MVFSSIPGYLDPPNWHHQQSSHHHHQQQGGGAADQNPHLLLPPPPGGGGDGGGNGGGGAEAGTTSNIRPGSMSDRARQAKLPQPETALKCPRCESTNTKFCYFNNYSLTQPRHFCKTCRRYWTRGGALRSVPVGGGCRRNKRSKRSKSPASASADHHHQRHAGGGGGGRGAGSISITVSNSNNCSTTNENLLISHLAPPPPPPHHFPFLPSLHHLSDYSSGGISFAGIQQPNSGVEFHSGSSGDVGSILSTGLVAEHWRSSLQVQQGHHQQFPFSANLEPPPSSHGLFQFEGNNAANYGRGNGTQHISKPVSDSSIGANNVKMEAESQQALNMSRNFLGSLGNHHQNYWGSSGGATNTTAAAAGGISNAWTDLSGFTSSTSHLL